MRTYSGSASGQCLVSFIVSKINIIGSQCFERTLGRGKTHKSIITVIYPHRSSEILYIMFYCSFGDCVKPDFIALYDTKLCMSYQ